MHVYFCFVWMIHTCSDLQLNLKNTANAGFVISCAGKIIGEGKNKATAGVGEKLDFITMPELTGFQAVLFIPCYSARNKGPQQHLAKPGFG